MSSPPHRSSPGNLQGVDKTGCGPEVRGLLVEPEEQELYPNKGIECATALGDLHNF